MPAEHLGKKEKQEGKKNETALCKTKKKDYMHKSDRWLEQTTSHKVRCANHSVDPLRYAITLGCAVKFKDNTKGNVSLR